MLRCACGRRLIIDRSADRLILRCPKHGIVLRYYARLNSTTGTTLSPPSSPPRRR